MQKRIKLHRYRGKCRSNKHAGIVDAIIPMKVVTQQLEKNAENVENSITLQTYVEAVQRNRHVDQENKITDQLDPYNRNKTIPQPQILTSHTFIH